MAPRKIRAAPGPVFGRDAGVDFESVSKRVTSGKGPMNLEKGVEDPVWEFEIGEGVEDPVWEFEARLIGTGKFV